VIEHSPRFDIVRGDLEEVVFTFDRADEALVHARTLSAAGESKVKIRDDFDRVHTVSEFDDLFVSPWISR
jgi:hypothetical protein